MLPVPEAPAPRRRGLWSRLGSVPPSIGGTAVLLALAAALRPQLLSPMLLLLILRQAVPLGLAAIG